MLNLADKNFKAVIINTFKELKKVCERITKYQKRKKSIEKREIWQLKIKIDFMN